MGLLGHIKIPLVAANAAPIASSSRFPSVDLRKASAIKVPLLVPLVSPLTPLFEISPAEGVKQNVAFSAANDTEHVFPSGLFEALIDINAGHRQSRRRFNNERSSRT
jgi:hypothetical protein